MTVSACVIGWPIEHSRSPLIHGYWIGKHGLDARYTKEAVKPDAVEQFLKRIRSGELAGCNVTVPHKETVLMLADDADAAASAIGAANTLWLEGGRLMAANTDAYGFLANLDDSAPGWNEDAGAALVLGAGGAARAVLHALIERGFGNIRLVNRTRARADALAAHFGDRIAVSDWDARNEVCRGATLVVNTTTLGMIGAQDLDIDLAAAPAGAVVNDLVYAPLETPLLAQARTRGLEAVDGLGMLLHQAVPGFEKWFGVCPAVTPELRALAAADLEA